MGHTWHFITFELSSGKKSIFRIKSSTIGYSFSMGRITVLLFWSSIARLNHVGALQFHRDFLKSLGDGDHSIKPKVSRQDKVNVCWFWKCSDYSKIKITNLMFLF